jgi:hypothetical protein
MPLWWPNRRDHVLQRIGEHIAEVKGGLDAAGASADLRN